MDPHRLAAHAIHHDKIMTRNNVGNPVFAAFVGHACALRRESGLTSFEPRHPQTHSRVVHWVAVLIEHHAGYRAESREAENEVLPGLARAKCDYTRSVFRRWRTVPSRLVAVTPRVQPVSSVRNIRERETPGAIRDGQRFRRIVFRCRKTYIRFANG